MDNGKLPAKWTAIIIAFLPAGIPYYLGKTLASKAGAPYVLAEILALILVVATCRAAWALLANFFPEDENSN